MGILMKDKPIVKAGQHFDAIHFHSHIMMDALAKHLLGLAPFGMTDVGEVLDQRLSVQIKLQIFS